jgi:cytochrome c oxidase subunit 1
MTIPGSIENAQRQRGFNNGLFQWLRKAPWGNPAFAGMFISLILFGFLGGISGVVMGTEQLNLIMHNTLYVPGHFHGTVVAGTTLAFMAVTYLLVPLIFRREIMFKKLAQIQPYLFGLGVAGISVFMMGAGTLGVSRRHWDITFADAIMGFDYPATAYLMLAANGISAVLASLGGIIYVFVVVSSVFFGRKIGANEKVMDIPAPAAVSHYGSATKISIPGTAVLVAVFFISFVLYYFVNWKYLSDVWPLR